MTKKKTWLRQTEESAMRQLNDGLETQEKMRVASYNATPPDDFKFTGIYPLIKMETEKTNEQKALDAYIAETQAKIDDLIEECRAKEAQVEGFGHQFLDQIVKNEGSGIPEAVIKGIRKCIDDPGATCILKFNANGL